MICDVGASRATSQSPPLVSIVAESRLLAPSCAAIFKACFKRARQNCCRAWWVGGVPLYQRSTRREIFLRRKKGYGVQYSASSVVTPQFRIDMDVDIAISDLT
jgi:hypothetical protein